MRLPVPVQRGPHVLAGTGLGALAAAPQHVGRRAELGGQVDVAQHLGQREPAHVAVVGGERAVLEDRVAEQVRGRHRHHQARCRPAPRGTARSACRGRVVGCRTGSGRRRGSSPRTAPSSGQPVHGLDRVQRRAGRRPKTSWPCQPTVQSPNENLSSGRAGVRVVSGSCHAVSAAQDGVGASPRRPARAAPAARPRRRARVVPSAIASMKSRIWWVKRVLVADDVAGRPPAATYGCSARSPGSGGSPVSASARWRRRTPAR